MASNFGSAFSDAFASQQKIGIAEEAQRQAQQAQQFEQDAARKAEAEKHIQQLLTVAANVTKAAADAGKDPATIAGAIQPLSDAAAQVAGVYGPDGPIRVQGMFQALLARPPAALAPENNKAVVKTGQDMLGAEQYQVFDKSKGTLTPIQPPAPVNPNAASINLTGPSTTVTGVDYGPVTNTPNQRVSDTFQNLSAKSGPQAQGELNEQFLSTLPQNIQDVIRAVANGKIDIKSFSIRGGHREKILSLVSQYDPSFDTINAPARAATYKGFTSGLEARNITALGTVINHIDELDKAGAALDNFKSNAFGFGTQAVNKARTWVLENKQDPRVRVFDTNADAVSNELERVFRGSQTALAGIQEWRKNLNPAMSPDQMREVNKKLGKLLIGRFSELNDQFNRGMGLARDQEIQLKLDALGTQLERLGTAGSFGEAEKSAPQPVERNFFHGKKFRFEAIPNGG